MPRIGAIWIIFLAIGAALMIAPAAAHSPYFTQPETIVLPDGTTGQIRLLHGDGILRSDPVRAIVVDAEGRALARSPQSYAMAIRCDGVRQCKVYDLNHLAVSTPDLTTFRVGGLISDENERWSLEGGSDSWGFATRRMSLDDAFFGHTAYLMDNKFDAAMPLLFTALALAFVLGVLRPAPSQQAFNKVVWYGIIVAAFCLAGLFVLLSILTLMVSGLPVQLWFMLSATAAMTVGLLFYWHRRKQVVPAQ
jgi:hypothetical protein